MIITSFYSQWRKTRKLILFQRWTSLQISRSISNSTETGFYGFDLWLSFVKENINGKHADKHACIYLLTWKIPPIIFWILTFQFERWQKCFIIFGTYYLWYILCLMAINPRTRPYYFRIFNAQKFTCARRLGGANTSTHCERNLLSTLIL